jgi:hypothetical protein
MTANRVTQQIHSSYLGCYPGQSLNTSEKHQNDNNEESEAYASCWDIAPLAAVRPPRQRPHERQDQKDDQDSSKHCLFLSKRIHPTIFKFPSPGDIPYS